LTTSSKCGKNKKRRPAGRLTNKSAHGFTCGFKSRQTGKTLAKEPKIKAPSFLNEGALQGLGLLTFSARESFCPIELVRLKGFEPPTYWFVAVV